MSPRPVCPFDEWFDTLAPAIQARLNVRLDRVSLGNFGDHQSVGGEIYELRFFFRPGYRIYYGVVGKRIELLLTYRVHTFYLSSIPGYLDSIYESINSHREEWVNAQDLGL